MNNRKLFCTLLAGIWLLSGALFAADKKRYVFGIVPQYSAYRLSVDWQPIMRYLSKKTGYQIEFATAKNIPEFERNLRNGVYDIAYMNPYHYVVFHKQSGYRALAKARDKKIYGIIVVHKDSKIKSLKDLENTKLAFPSPLAFAASILTRGELKKRNIHFKPVYVSSHESVYMTIMHKIFPAGGGVVRTFNASGDTLKSNLRVLHKTRGYTPHAVGVHPRISQKVAQNLMQALESMDKTESGKKLLQKLKIKGFIPAHNSDWDDVRKLDIK